jgi:putative transposase
VLTYRRCVSVYIPRFEIPYGYYHVGTRGNNRRSIFEDDRDRNLFLTLLTRVARRFGWQFYAYCLMPNHYHLVLQIADKGLSKGMCLLNTGYATLFNDRHERSNHLFGKRFWSELILTDAYLIAATRYVLQNPVRAGLTRTCDEWEWSSYRATVGKAPPRTFLAIDELLAIVQPGGFDSRVESFRKLCASPAPKRRVSSSRVWRQPH